MPEALDGEHRDRRDHHEDRPRGRTPAPRFSSPGRPRKRKIATGSVGASGRARNTVAPNSPSEMANANPAATASARPATRRSISRHTRPGDAPSSAAASRCRSSIARSVGTTIRTTNGIATSAWTTGTIHGAERKSIGGSSSAITNPKPSITAEAPSGSMSMPSSSLAPRTAGYRERGEAADHNSDHRRAGRVHERVCDRLPRLDEQRRSSTA